MVASSSLEADDFTHALAVGRSYAVLRTSDLDEPEPMLSGVDVWGDVINVRWTGPPAHVSFIGQNGALKATVEGAGSASVHGCGRRHVHPRRGADVASDALLESRHQVRRHGAACSLRDRRRGPHLGDALRHSHRMCARGFRCISIARSPSGGGAALFPETWNSILPPRGRAVQRSGAGAKPPGRCQRRAGRLAGSCSDGRGRVCRGAAGWRQHLLVDGDHTRRGDQRPGIGWRDRLCRGAPVECVRQLMDPDPLPPGRRRHHRSLNGRPAALSARACRVAAYLDRNRRHAPGDGDAGNGRDTRAASPCGSLELRGLRLNILRRHLDRETGRVGAAGCPTDRLEPWLRSRQRSDRGRSSGARCGRSVDEYIADQPRSSRSA